MTSAIRRTLKTNLFIIISLLLHFLFLFGIPTLLFIFLTPPPPRLPELRPALYIPSYVASTPSAAHVPTTQSTRSKETDEVSPILSKPNLLSAQENPYAPPSITQPLLSQKSLAKQHEAPVHLIGDKALDDPLRKLLGQAITAHLVYPQLARELFLRGVSSIGFTIAPSGEVTHVRVVKSSGERILDNAAAAAIRDMAPVANVDIYLHEPKDMVVNIIF